MSSERRESRSAGRAPRVLSVSQTERARAPCAPGGRGVRTSYASGLGPALKRTELLPGRSHGPRGHCGGSVFRAGGELRSPPGPSQRPRAGSFRHARVETRG